MKFQVSCPDCRVGVIAEYPNQDDADECVRRHHTLQGHEAVVATVLDTPMEGLLL